MHKKLLVGIITAAMLVPTGVAYAAPEPTTKVELNVEPEQFIAQEVRFDPSTGRTEGLEALRELRGKMWDINPKFQGFGYEGYTGKLRDAAKAEGLNSKAEYMDVTMDADLAWIAIQRAYEASAVFSHKRPDGSDMATATIASHAVSTESLAAATDSLSTAILQSWGQDELKALQQAKGVRNAQNGHLVNLLHPKQRHYGFSALSVEGSEYGTYYVGVSSEVPAGETDSADHTPAGEQTVILHRAAKADETPTGLATAKKAEAADGTKDEAAEDEQANNERPLVEVKKIDEIFKPRK
ncbi:CAP domain-containing protein [Corynebacterium pseudopelargi]|uniref:SCP domain-containing protein n=1 Tax=Corynebacterium pseudopelargi TaxID=2080757 RepID=A0A3G6ITK2_9CORY|nr:CAP domain-containing protein [Corynebacterium pseudopelargi]AZA09051.1 hypothetical protein CPPEL_04620 [Corynebacterium pseudopelargi]